MGDNTRISSFLHFDNIVEIVILVWERGGHELEPKVYLSVGHIFVFPVSGASTSARDLRK